MVAMLFSLLSYLLSNVAGSKGAPVILEDIADLDACLRSDKTGKLSGGVTFDDVAALCLAQKVGNGFGRKGPEFAQIERVNAEACLAQDVDSLTNGSVGAAPANQECIRFFLSI